VYGRTRLEGDRLALRETGGSALFLRTVRLYSATDVDFVATILRQMTEPVSIDVIADQVGP
jgi:dTDP-4-dehydrorhamnose reductase